MTYQEIIAMKLREIRVSKKLSQIDLGIKAKVPKSSISYYENGRITSLDQLDKVCKGLGIDMFQFLDECKREKEKQDKNN